MYRVTVAVAQPGALKVGLLGSVAEILIVAMAGEFRKHPTAQFTTTIRVNLVMVVKVAEIVVEIEVIRRLQRILHKIQNCRPIWRWGECQLLSP
ncbi:Uncharacterised protein [Yersinia enterocolitica]|nr:Uncharacterised protein [Yersinia enterocolitica]